MKFTRIFGGLLAAAALAISGLSVPAAHAAGSGGPVSGKFKAHSAITAGWCSVACINSGMQIGRRNDGSYMSAPDFYSVTINRTTKEFRVTNTSVATGTYKLAYYGEPYDNRVKVGYLKRVRDNLYTITRDWSQGTGFTVQEAQALNLGTLNLQSEGSAGASMKVSPNLIIMGGEAHNRMTARNIPHNAKIIVKSYGCGKVKTKRVIYKGGDFNYRWIDRKAHRHYRKVLKLRAVMVQPGYRNKVLVNHHWNVERFRWRCR